MSTSIGLLTDAVRAEALRRALAMNFLQRYFEFLQNHWDNINYKWHLWVINNGPLQFLQHRWRKLNSRCRRVMIRYNHIQQRRFLKKMGFGWPHFSELLLGAAVLVVVPLFLCLLTVFLKRQAVPADPMLRLYRFFCLKLEKAGLQRLQWEGPMQFSRKAIVQFPHKAEEIQNFTDLFVQLRYGRLPVSRARLKELKHHLREL